MSIIQTHVCKNLILFCSFASILVLCEQFVSAQSGTRVIPQRIVPNRSNTRTVIKQGAESKSSRSGSGTRSIDVAKSVGLSGYCPVCIVDSKKWVKGSSQFSSQFDGAYYFFPNAGIKQKFDVSPSSYVPALGGYDVVEAKKNNQLVKGSVFEGAVLYQGRVYLFSSKGNKSMFMNAAADYDKIDLAFGGMCAVCKAAGTEHAGKAEFRFVYNRMTYLFPSEKELAEFKSNPSRYAQK